MYKNTLYLTVLLSLFSTLSGWSQREAQFTQYMYNTSIINPAYAGSRGIPSIFGSYRAQWVGLDGAPVTGAFSAHTPVVRDSNVGMGISFLNDRIGPSDQSNLSVDFSYTIDLGYGYDTHLAFGLKGTAELLNVDYTKLNIRDNDTQFKYNIDNRFSPNIGAGIYLYTDTYYAGFSIPTFLETKFFEGNSDSVVIDKVSYYLMGGYIFEMSDAVKLKPTLLAKFVSGSPIQTDISTSVLFHDKFSVGLAWRWDAAVSAMAGFQISDTFFMGYSYDADTSNLGNYNSGSHEVFMRFEILNNKNIDKVISPRFF